MVLLAGALLASAESCREYNGKYDSTRANILATQLRVIAFGPEFPIGAAGGPFERVKFERVPSDWKRKRTELSLCGRETKFRHRVRQSVRGGGYTTGAVKETFHISPCITRNGLHPGPFLMLRVGLQQGSNSLSRFSFREEDCSDNTFTGLSSMNPRVL